MPNAAPQWCCGGTPQDECLVHSTVGTDGRPFETFDLLSGVAPDWVGNSLVFTTPARVGFRVHPWGLPNGRAFDGYLATGATPDNLSLLPLEFCLRLWSTNTVVRVTYYDSASQSGARTFRVTDSGGLKYPVLYHEHRTKSVASKLSSEVRDILSIDAIDRVEFPYTIRAFNNPIRRMVSGAFEYGHPAYTVDTPVMHSRSGVRNSLSGAVPPAIFSDFRRLEAVQFLAGFRVNGIYRLPVASDTVAYRRQDDVPQLERLATSGASSLTQYTVQDESMAIINGNQGIVSLRVFQAGQYDTEPYAINFATMLATKIKDLSTAAGGSQPRGFVSLGDIAIFSANDTATSRQLWKTDGTSAGTVMLANIRPGANAAISELTQCGSKVFFRADDGVNGEELWATDGTTTWLVKNLRAGGSGSVPAKLTAFGNYCFFVADDGVNGRRLWVSDGTDSGTVMIGGIGIAGDLTIRDICACDTFVAFSLLVDGGYQLWRSSETTASLVKLLNPGAAEDVSSFTARGSEVFFSGLSTGIGRELWKTDGTSLGTVLTRQLGNGAGGSNPQVLGAADGVVVFLATPYWSSEQQLFSSDGTRWGTWILHHRIRRAGSSSPCVGQWPGGGIVWGDNYIEQVDGTGAGPEIQGVHVAMHPHLTGTWFEIEVVSGIASIQDMKLRRVLGQEKCPWYRRDSMAASGFIRGTSPQRYRFVAPDQGTRPGFPDGNCEILNDTEIVMEYYQTSSNVLHRSDEMLLPGFPHPFILLESLCRMEHFELSPRIDGGSTFPSWVYAPESAFNSPGPGEPEFGGVPMFPTYLPSFLAGPTAGAYSKPFGYLRTLNMTLALDHQEAANTVFQNSVFSGNCGILVAGQPFDIYMTSGDLESQADDSLPTDTT